MIIIKNNFYVITGGPGAGKTTLLESLCLSGYLTVNEVAREIICRQNKTGKRLDILTIK